MYPAVFSDYHITELHHFLSTKNYNHPLGLLGRDRTVLQWLCGDLSFLDLPLDNILPQDTLPQDTLPQDTLPQGPKKTKAQLSEELRRREKQWGMERLGWYQTHTNKPLPEKQWTNAFGENLAKELLFLLGTPSFKPQKIGCVQADLETEDALWEVKTGTYYTEGTAHEKIYGVPFKYADIPTLCQKPVKILCLGGAEKRCRKDGFLEGPQCTGKKKEFLDYCRENHIECLGATDILTRLIRDA
jgi:hypothetical protein